MQSNNYFQSKIQLFGIFGLAMIMTSCGSYQYAGYDDDAIYGDSEKSVEYTEATSQTENTSDNSGYYKGYFKEKSEQYADIAQDDNAIFTDIDSYEDDYQEEVDSESYAGWGQEHNDDVTINVYGGHLFNSIRWNYQFYPYWLNNYGFGYGYGHYRPFYGYNNFFSAYWCPPYYYYGGGYGYYGYNNFYYGNSYRGYYGSRAVAYNASRRNSGYSNSNLANLTRRNSLSAASRRNGSSLINRGTTRSRIGNRVGSNNTRPNIRPNTRPRVGGRVGSNSTRPKGISTRPNTRPNTGTRPNTSSRTKKSRVNSNTRPAPRVRSTPRRNNSSINRSSPSRSSRSTGSSRSSGSRSSSSKRGGGL